MVMVVMMVGGGNWMRGLERCGRAFGELVTGILRCCQRGIGECREFGRKVEAWR